MRRKWMRCVFLSIAAIFAICLGYVSKPAVEPSGSGAGESVDAARESPRARVKVAVGLVGEALEMETRRYVGQVVSASNVSLVPRVSGEVMGVLFKEGESVKMGDPLFELDPVRYEAAVKNAEAKVAECRFRLAYAENSHRRVRNLYLEKAASKDNLENSLSEYEVAGAMLLAAEAALSTARDDLKNTLVVAPIAGKAGLARYAAGSYVTPNSGALTTIVQTDPLRVAFSLGNRDLLSMFRTEKELKEKAVVRIRLADGSLYGRSGVVELVDNQADRHTDTIQAYAKIGNPEGILVPGSVVTVLLSRTSGRMAPAVPPSAILRDAKSAYVYVVADGDVVERREVDLGFNDGETQIVREGLSPGELVVVDGMHKTRPGGAVTPVRRG